MDLGEHWEHQTTRAVFEYLKEGLYGVPLRHSESPTCAAIANPLISCFAFHFIALIRSKEHLNHRLARTLLPNFYFKTLIN